MFGEVREDYAEEKYKRALKKLKKIIKMSIDLLDVDMAIRARTEMRSIYEVYRAEILKKHSQFLQNLSPSKREAFEQLEAKMSEEIENNFIRSFERRTNSLIQKAEKKFQEQKYKKAAYLFLEASFRCEDSNDKIRAQGLLGRFKLARTYIELSEP